MFTVTRRRQSAAGSPVRGHGSETTAGDLLPSRTKALYVASSQRIGAWLVQGLVQESGADVVVVEAQGVAAAASRMREEVFDLLLVTHDAQDLDAVEFVEGLRAGGGEDPVVILGQHSDQQLATAAYEVGADAYLCVNTSTTSHLIWTAGRAIARFQMIRENRRIVQGDRIRQQQEQQEAQRLLDQLRMLIERLDTAEAARLTTRAARDAARQATQSLPERLVAHYREMMRAYVIMGAGDMAEEIRSLAELLVRAGVTARQTIAMHLGVQEETVRGLGNRSARHVMTRSDRLALELTVFLAEGYRDALLRRVHPPRQMALPGFDAALLGEAPSAEDF